jgi:hypothetical protein
MRKFIFILSLVIIGCSSKPEERQVIWSLKDPLYSKVVEMDNQYPDSIIARDIKYFELEIINQLADSIGLPLDKYGFIDSGLIEVDCSSGDCGFLKINELESDTVYMQFGETMRFELRDVELDDTCKDCTVIWSVGYNAYEQGKEKRQMLKIKKTASNIG